MGRRLPFWYAKSSVRMTWWFIILGISTLVIVLVAIALYVRIRSHMIASATRRHALDEPEHERHADKI